MSASIVAAAVFNLICTGEETAGTPVQGSLTEGLTRTPFTEVYRVDTESQRWCRDKCTTTSAIVKLSPMVIQFQLEKSEETETWQFAYARREDGYFEHNLKIGNWVSVKIGECKRAPFTGFPVKRF